MDEEKTIVIFRVWTNTTHGIIALFPDNKFDVGGSHCSSYQHIGQHGAANYPYVIQQTRPAIESEYKDLFDELTKVGYNLEVRKRWNRRK